MFKLYQCILSIFYAISPCKKVWFFILKRACNWIILSKVHFLSCLPKICLVLKEKNILQLCQKLLLLFPLGQENLKLFLIVSLFKLKLKDTFICFVYKNHHSPVLCSHITVALTFGNWSASGQFTGFKSKLYLTPYK